MGALVGRESGNEAEEGGGGKCGRRAGRRRTTVEKVSTGNLKQTWTSLGLYCDLSDAHRFAGDYFLRRATQIKNVWIPYGA